MTDSYELGLVGIPPCVVKMLGPNSYPYYSRSVGMRTTEMLQIDSRGDPRAEELADGKVRIVCEGAEDRNGHECPGVSVLCEKVDLKDPLLLVISNKLIEECLSPNISHWHDESMMPCCAPDCFEPEQEVEKSEYELGYDGPYWTSKSYKIEK